MKIEPYHFNAARTAHGGAIFTLADFAFAVASNSHGTLAMAINASISFVKAAKMGTSMISFVKGKTEISHNFPNYHRQLFVAPFLLSNLFNLVL